MKQPPQHPQHPQAPRYRHALHQAHHLSTLRLVHQRHHLCQGLVGILRAQQLQQLPRTAALSQVLPGEAVQDGRQLLCAHATEDGDQDLCLHLGLVQGTCYLYDRCDHCECVHVCI